MAIAHRIVPELTPREVARFWNLVAVGQPDECWLWLGSDRHAKGRGKFRPTRCPHMIYSNRIAFAIGHFCPPPGMLVCHTCDNPRCMNPRHLFLGTQSDNMRDMLTKGRGHKARGEKQHKAKLTEDDVRAIRLRYRRGKGTGCCAEQLGPEYGVTPELIRGIVARKHWKHVA